MGRASTGAPSRAQFRYVPVPSARETPPSAEGGDANVAASSCGRALQALAPEQLLQCTSELVLKKDRRLRPVLLPPATCSFDQCERSLADLDLHVVISAEQGTLRHPRCPPSERLRCHLRSVDGARHGRHHPGSPRRVPAHPRARARRRHPRASRSARRGQVGCFRRGREGAASPLGVVQARSAAPQPPAFPKGSIAEQGAPPRIRA